MGTCSQRKLSLWIDLAKQQVLVVKVKESKIPVVKSRTCWFTIEKYVSHTCGPFALFLKDSIQKNENQHKHDHGNNWNYKFVLLFGSTIGDIKLLGRQALVGSWDSRLKAAHCIACAGECFQADSPIFFANCIFPIFMFFVAIEFPTVIICMRGAAAAPWTWKWRDRGRMGPVVCGP